jgi:transcriptional regulator with XRE-family HTH domain|tara:strand:- start:46 stop:303 length:258 start_codon:yes stop_codon:yes gene_type:complete
MSSHDRRVCKYCKQEIKIPNTVGGRIHFKRNQKGISVATLGSILNPPMSGQYIRSVENGKADVRLGQLRTLATYFKVSLDFFIGE